jgi:predicted Zn-dependent protease with MMP-like domain
MDFQTLAKWADEEVKGILAALPPELIKPAQDCSISFEERPGRGIADEELEGDELGLFSGPSLMEQSSSPGGEIPSVRLFLMNLWEWVEQDEQDFRDEVGITFMHELGHYFGWDEQDIEERGLE